MRFKHKEYRVWRFGKGALSILIIVVGLALAHGPIYTGQSRSDAGNKVVINPPAVSPSQASPNTPPSTQPAQSSVSNKQSAPTLSIPAHTSSTVNLGGEFYGADRILTNEYVHWNPSSTCPYTSSIWDMTSGTLFVKNGMGYSGVPTTEASSTCYSNQQTNSATFRLNSKRFDFSNITFSLDYLVVAHTSGGAPLNSYDGVHLWVGYQNEYALYAASIFRWDSTLVIKKKVPLTQMACTDPSNGGCYTDLTNETKYPSLTTANAWHHADITFRHSGSTSTIVEAMDGKTIYTTTDNGTNGNAYSNGAVGIRGDNTEFYFKNVTIVQL